MSKLPIFPVAMVTAAPLGRMEDRAAMANFLKVMIDMQARPGIRSELITLMGEMLAEMKTEQVYLQARKPRSSTELLAIEIAEDCGRDWSDCGAYERQGFMFEAQSQLDAATDTVGLVPVDAA